MIIGFDGSRAFQTSRTGTENYSYQLLKALMAVDTENSYRVYLRDAVKTNQNVFPDNFHAVNINFHRLWTQLGLASKLLTARLDLLFIPSHTLPILRNPNLKTIITVHDLGAEYLPKTHQLKQQLYLKYMTRYQLASSTHIIAVSEATKADLVKKINLPPEKITVIYEGVDKQLFKPVKAELLSDTLRKYYIERDKYIVFVGTIQPRKNLIRLIKAYSDLLKILESKPKAQTHHSLPKLVLVGGKGWLSDEIYALPKKLNIDKQVKFLGRVKDEDLPSLYSGALGFAFPSLFEGFGLPIIEAQSCGCPVITSNLSSMPEVAGDAALLVDPYNTEAITKALQQIVENKDLRSDLIKKGFKNAQKFSWEKAAQETLSVFQKVYNI